MVRLRRQTVARYGLAVFLFVLAACGSATPAPTATPLPPPPTLPPAWTVTPTFTPLPPTLTRTPTLTPTITPTLSREAICEQFEVVHQLRNGIELEDDGILAMIIESPPGTTVRFLARHTLSSQNLGLDMNANGDTIIMQLALSQFPVLGSYRWSVVVLTEEYGELCEQRGTFRLVAAPPDGDDEDATNTPAQETPTADS